MRLFCSRYVLSTKDPLEVDGAGVPMPARALFLIGSM